MLKQNRISESTQSRNGPDPDFNEQIAKRAYQYWEGRGREDGYDLEDWLKAEQDLSQPVSFGQPSAK